MHVRRHRLGMHAATILALSALATGCGRMVAIKYEATNPWKGQGAVTVVPFRYEAAEDHRVSPREVETNRAANTELYLSQEIGAFFTEAFRRELAHSGYRIEESSPRTVSGAITRFFVDWLEDERFFELHAVYTVGSVAENGFAWECSSIQRGPNALAQDSVLIRRGTADCMQRFIRAAQDAHVL
ncbi:MAG: hypothetical protein ABW047_10690 [Nitrospiraceae bacterium]